jgi:hypothetical protein
MELIIFFYLGTSVPTVAEIWRTTSQQEKNNSKIFDEVQAEDDPECRRFSIFIWKIEWPASCRTTYDLEV